MQAHRDKCLFELPLIGLGVCSQFSIIDMVEAAAWSWLSTSESPKGRNQKGEVVCSRKDALRCLAASCFARCFACIFDCLQLCTLTWRLHRVSQINTKRPPFQGNSHSQGSKSQQVKKLIHKTTKQETRTRTRRECIHNGIISSAFFSAFATMDSIEFASSQSVTKRKLWSSRDSVLASTGWSRTISSRTSRCVDWKEQEREQRTADLVSQRILPTRSSEPWSARATTVSVFRLGLWNQSLPRQSSAAQSSPRPTGSASNRARLSETLSPFRRYQKQRLLVYSSSLQHGSRASSTRDSSRQGLGSQSRSANVRNCHGISRRVLSPRTTHPTTAAKRDYARSSRTRHEQ